MDRLLSHQTSFAPVATDQWRDLAQTGGAFVLADASDQPNGFDREQRIVQFSSVRDRDIGVFPIPTHRDAI